MSETDPAWHPEQMPTLLIVHLAHLLSKVSDTGLRRVGITASQLPVLVALKNGERRMQTELARIAGVEQPSMAQLLGRMERDGLIHRKPAPDDRRRSLVSLTDTALQRLEPGRNVLREVDRTALKGLDKEEQELLIRLLGRIAQSIEAAS